MESEKNGVKCWLKARTVGLCATFNRLIGFWCVRSTKPVTFLPSVFVQAAEYSSRRSEYPDPLFYLSLLGKYYFRNKSLLHLRIEQFNRFLVVTEDTADSSTFRCSGIEEAEDDDDAVDSSRFVENEHRSP